MEQIVVIEQSKADLTAIIEQVRNEKGVIVLTDKDKLPIKISLAESQWDNQKGKRLGGFLKGSQNTPVPDDFDRMNEDEIFALFAGEYDEYSRG